MQLSEINAKARRMDERYEELVTSSDCLNLIRDIIEYLLENVGDNGIKEFKK
jgi:hypothetical protein